MCSSRKYPHSPHRRDWNFLGDGGFQKIKKYKEMYEALPEFPEGWGGVRKKIPSVGEVWIFSGTTQSTKTIIFMSNPPGGGGGLPYGTDGDSRWRF